VQKPTVLIPFPFATHDHQRINAKIFQQESQFPVVIYEGNDLKKDIAPLLTQLTQWKNYIYRPEPKSQECNSRVFSWAHEICL
jgi:UDP-N-acetylglucosamine:LPS N-acetylglucosamine transferase